MPREMVEYLTRSLRLEPDDVYEIDGVLDASDLMELYNLHKPELRDKPLQMTVPASLRKNGCPFEQLRSTTCCCIILTLPIRLSLIYPGAAQDPKVAAIKICLYRTARTPRFPRP